MRSAGARQNAPTMSRNLPIKHATNGHTVLSESMRAILPSQKNPFSIRWTVSRAFCPVETSDVALLFTILSVNKPGTVYLFIEVRAHGHAFDKISTRCYERVRWINIFLEAGTARSRTSREWSTPLVNILSVLTVCA